MGRKSLHEITFPRVKKYMSEIDKAVTVKDIAQHLEMSPGGTYNVMQLMEVFKMVQKVKRGKHYYFLKDVYDDEQIEAMLPPKKIAPIPRRRRYRSIRARSIPAPPAFDESFMEEYLSAVRVESSSGEGISALSMIGLSRQEIDEEDIPTRELLGDLDIDDLYMEVEERKFGSPIMNEPFATVEYLPKELRLLNSGETRYLKEQIKGLPGYDEIDRFGSVFAKFSALECGRYGNVVYFSLGTNQWDYVKKVTIDRSTADFIVLPSVERKRWSAWNQFLMGLTETGERYSKEEYDKIIDQFMESGHSLVEITVEKRTAIYVRNILINRIIERGLEEQVKASRVNEWIYLEKAE